MSALCNTVRPLVMRQKLAFLGLVSTLLLPVGAHGADEVIPEAVTVEGNRRVEADAVKAAVTVRPGRPLDPRRLDEDIKALMKLGFFSDVVVESRGDPRKPTIVFRVKEKPAVREAKVVGNEELSKDDFKDLIEVKQYSILDLGQVQKTVKKIQNKYVEKGFNLAEVSHRIEERPDNQVDVVFVVNEHAKVQVKQIRILGNEHVPREDLLSAMQTQEGGLLSFMTGAGAYREEVFQRDLFLIQGVYAERGYVYAKVSRPSVTLSPDKRSIFITIRIEEGDQYRIGKIDFSGELIHDKAELHELIKVEPGELFARSKIQKDLFAVADLYKDAGYANANVNPDTKIDAKSRIIDLTYDVQPGRKVFFERIEISGNVKTRDRVIRRELRIYEGELYSGTGINKSRERVNALGYFESVNVTTEKGSADDKLIARITVKERSTGTFQIGAGFSSYENFILTSQISQNNFFGWGQTLSLSVQYSSIRQLGQIQFSDPHFLDTQWTFAFDLYRSEGSYTSFTRTATGGSLTFGYELSGLQDWIAWTRHLEDLRLFATYTNEYVNVEQLAGFVPYGQYKSGTTSSMRFTLQLDKRDNRLFPTKGFYETVSAELAPPLLAPSQVFGNSVNLFTRYSLDSRFYHPLFWAIVARARLSAGYIQGWDDQHTIPISEKYYLGGINSVRGYRMLSLSPTQWAGIEPRGDTALGTLISGGNKQVTINLELEFPLFDKIGFRGVVFYDLGNAYKEGTFLRDPDHAGLFLSMFRSVGFGLRWFSPIGPLRFEWGFPLDRRIDPFSKQYIDSVLDFQFTIGNFF